VAQPALEEHGRSRLAGDTLEQTHVNLVEVLQKLMPDAVRVNWLASMQACLLA